MQNKFDFKDISVRGVCMELLRYCWMILLAATAVWLGATGIGELTYTPQFTSFSTLVVSVKGSSNAYSSLTTANQMADVFREVFQSDALRETIAADLGEEIQASISCSLIDETNLLVLSASASNPRQAYLYIHSALEHYEEVSEYVFANASLEIVQEPNVPSEPSNQSILITRRNELTLLGAAAMAALIFLLYVCRFTVKNVSAAQRLLDGTIRGTIPYENLSKKRKMRNGKGKRVKEAPLLSSPLVSMDFAEAARKTQAQVEHHMRRKGQKVLLVTGFGENEGKTTVAANLAIALAEKHKKVLLIDGDFRKPALYKLFGKKDNREQKGNSLESVLLGKTRWQDAAVVQKPYSIQVLYQYRPSQNPSGVLTTANLKCLMEECRDEVDYVIVDCPPVSVAADAEVWMQAADTVLLVVRQDWSDVRAVNDTVDLAWQSCGDFTGFVLNAFREEWNSGKGSYGYRPYTGTVNN